MSRVWPPPQRGNHLKGYSEGATAGDTAGAFATARGPLAAIPEVFFVGELDGDNVAEENAEL